MFNNTLNEFMWQAEDAGIYSEINPKSDHLEIAIDGWSDTMDSFASEYFTKLKSFTATEKIFNDQKESQIIAL